MKKQRPDFQTVQNIFKAIEKKAALDKRRRRLYNRKYRKSIFFISVWVGRIVYFILFWTIATSHNNVHESQLEIIEGVKVVRYTRSYDSGDFEFSDLTISTAFGSYDLVPIEGDPPLIAKGDTAEIFRNYYGKPIYFSKPYWKYKYVLESNLVLYSMILFATFVSFFFNDGLDRFTDKLLLIVWSADILGIALYFFTGV